MSAEKKPVTEKPAPVKKAPIRRRSAVESLEKKAAMVSKPEVAQWASAAPVGNSGEPTQAFSIRLRISTLRDIDTLMASLPGVRSKNKLIERYIIEGVKGDIAKLNQKK